LYFWGIINDSHMRFHFRYLFRLPCLLLLVMCLEACEKDAYRDNLTEKGSVYAGEDDRRVQQVDVGEGTVYDNGQHTLVIEAEKKLVFSSSSYYSNTPDAHGASATMALSGGIEYASEPYVYATYHCSHWSTDSMWHFNEVIYGCIEGTPCDSVASDISTRFRPTLLEYGDPIDGSLSWRTGSVDLYSNSGNSSTTPRYTPFLHYEYNSSSGGCDYWGNGKGKYVGIRWPEKGDYRYGYVELGVAGVEVHVHAIGVSKK
jgi:hypothetical protein